MYTNLLANSMDRKTEKLAHPAFVEIIKNMNSDEAKIMQYFATHFRTPIIDIESSKSGEKGQLAHIQKASLIGYESGCEFPELTPNYLDNLNRLGLISIRYDIHLTAESIYDSIINHSTTKEWKDKIEQEGRIFVPKNGLVERTDLGFQFCKTCVIDKHTQV